MWRARWDSSILELFGMTDKQKITAIGLLLLLGGLFWYHAQPLEELGVQPVVNADGTIDYTLRDKWLNDERPYDWVLRFPADQLVHDNWDDQEPRGINLGGSKVNATPRKNKRIGLYFRSFDPMIYVRKGESGIFKGTLRISITSDEYPRATYQRANDEFTQRNCKVLQKLKGGVTAYQSATNELSDISGCTYPVNDAFLTTFYLVRDDEGHIWADYHCNDRVQVAGVTSDCSGTLLLPNARLLYFDLPAKHFSTPTVTLKAIVAYIETHTVKSEHSARFFRDKL